MREILFRGKRPDAGWIFGSLLKVTFDGTTYNLIFADNFLFVFGQATSMEHADVIPETVGQYTGLTDKKGVKIFEGDIVKSVFNKQSYVVRFGEYVYETDYPDEMHGFYLENTIKKYDVSPFGCSYNWAVIIGNIHDNPELLGGNDNA